MSLLKRNVSWLQINEGYKMAKSNLLNLTLLLSSCLLLLSFTISSHRNESDHKITCTNDACFGTYSGPEFIHGDDIAHQFSNKMSAAVGDKLKELFRSKRFSKVDLAKIEMTTKGMGSGKVNYYLHIPFKQVKNQCDAYTSFDHVGGWNHKPALNVRKQQLSKALLKNHSLNISALKQTPEGLQEYWIQWKNKHVQAMCE